MVGSDVHGPIDTLVIEFPEATPGEQTAEALRALVDLGIVRLFDLMVVHKGGDGVCTIVEPGTAATGSLAGLLPFAGARSHLLGEDDLDDLSDVLEPGTAAAVIVYENAWAVPFVAAARSEGADVVASLRIGAQELMDALDADDAHVTA